MNTVKMSISIWVCLVLSALSLNAQTITTYQLPVPQQLTPLFIGPITGSGIYYGASPEYVNPNKPVIVYVHGFIDLNNAWFIPGNNMYDNTFNANQNCAFVAMTRGGGMWQNGQLLADMLDDITQHFGVSDVVLVAHSNGGKASEVAMITHNRRHKVERVISLGTPFYGTELANVAEAPGFNLLVDLIGLGGGMSTSTTYYMGGYARPLLDWSWRNQPGKFINFGAWGYNNGTTLARPVMTTSGALLNFLGSGAAVGGNDGVTPYWSSSRRWGRPQWTTGHGNPVSQFDHLDVSLSNVVWNSIEPLFTAPLSSLRANPNQVDQAAVVNETISSRLQFLSSEDKNRSFNVEKGIKDLEMIILHHSEDDQFVLQEVLASGKLAPIAFDLNANRTTSDLLNGKSTLLSLGQLPVGEYKVTSESQFAALINHKKGVELTYNNSHQFAFDQAPTFEVTLNQANQYDLSKLSLKAIITYKHNLDGSPLEKEVTIIETFEPNEEGTYTLRPTKRLSNGVYNMVIQAQHPEFQKSLVTGFVMNSEEAVPAKKTIETTVIALSVYPNPAKDVIRVSFENDQAAQVNLYDINGRVLHQQIIQETGQQQLQLDLNQLKLSQGTYFLEVQIGAEKTTEIFVKM
ncbi:MAG: pimeloyl-ACP methyl ester carboxylesterase [Aureispira sp.]|jgi:pimeloyl-ACP methyl ester carboxylesterase